jgi:hypothetical protein
MTASREKPRNKAHAAEQAVLAANARLSAKMKLNVALLDQRRIEVSENWYRLATTNAASVIFLHHTKGEVETAFLVRGRDIYEEWDDELLLATSEDVIAGIDQLTQKASSLK